MPYANNGQVSQAPIEGGIEITEAQYQEAIDAMLRGEVVTIDQGFHVGPTIEPEPPEPEPPSLDELAAAKRTEVDLASVTALAVVRNDYPDYEQLSWERQEREAREGGGPLIQAIADARGLPIEELISRIIDKADAYQQAAGVVIGRRQALRDHIDTIEADENLGDDEKRQAIESVEW